MSKGGGKRGHVVRSAALARVASSTLHVRVERREAAGSPSQMRRGQARPRWASRAGSLGAGTPSPPARSCSVRSLLLLLLILAISVLDCGPVIATRRDETSFHRSFPQIPRFRVILREKAPRKGVIPFAANGIYFVKSYYKREQKPKHRLRRATLSSGRQKRGYHMVRAVR